MAPRLLAASRLACLDDASIPPVNLRLRGMPALLQGDGGWSGLIDKDAALLALLALQGPLSRARLADWLWPDTSGPRRLGSLRQRLMRLDARSLHPLFERRGALVLLAPAVQHDMVRPGDLDVISPDTAMAPFLGSFTFDDSPELAAWVEQVRQNLRQRQLAAWSAQAESLEQQRRVAEALPYAQRLADEDPLHEHAQRRVMRLHYLRGDGGAALALYARLQSRLQQELGSLPSIETRELAALIERGTSAGIAATGVSASAEQLAQLRRPIELLEREVQWEQLQQAWDDGRSAVLVGEAGIGKSRLIDDFADAMKVPLRLGARPGDAQVPYALLGRLVRARAHAASSLGDETRAELARLEPSLGRAAPGTLVPFRLARAVAALLENDPSMVIDDLHHADVASLELLPLLLEAPRRALLAVRADTMPDIVAGWLRGDGRLQPVTLTPLAVHGVARLLGALNLSIAPAVAPSAEASLAEALLRHTGGNPYFVLETLRALVRAGTIDAPGGPLPVTEPVQRLIQQRMDSLTAQARAVAWVSGLAGGDFDAALAAHALGLTLADVMDPWRELQSAQLMNDRGFVHDLVGETLRITLPPALAIELHGRIALYLEQVGAAPARRASHWAAAGDHARAAQSHEAAAKVAATSSRKSEEQMHWAAAAAAHEQAGHPGAAFDARIELAQAMLLGGSIEEGLALAQELRQAARGMAQVARTSRTLAHAHIQASAWQAGLEHATQAIDAAHHAALPDVEIDVTLLAATAAAQLGHLTVSLAHVTRAEVLAAGHRPDKALLGVLEMKAYVLDRVGRYAEAAELCGQAIAMAQALGELNELMTLHSNFSSILGKLARVPDALVEARHAVAVGERIGQMQGYQGQIVTLHRGLYGALCGCFDGAVDDLERAVAGLDRLGLEFARLITENQLAWVWTMMGQVARAQRIVSAPIDGLPRMQAARRLSLRARLSRLCGGAPVAWPDDWLDHGVEPPVALSARIDKARAAPAEVALPLCAAVAQEAKALSLASGWFNARVGMVDALRQLDPARAAEAAHALWRDLQGHQPADAWWPEVLHVLQRAYRAAGDVEAADELVHRAVTWLQAAQATLPSPFRASFAERNKVNAALLLQHRRGRR